jgi:transcription elongation factor Elf1
MLDRFLKMDRQHRYMQRLKHRLLEQFGGKCQNPRCGSVLSLQFAHINHNHGTVHGCGRGQGRRLHDVRKNPKLYVLLCRECHLVFDFQQEQLGSNANVTSQTVLQEVEFLREIRGEVELTPPYPEEYLKI